MHRRQNTKSKPQGNKPICRQHFKRLLQKEKLEKKQLKTAKKASKTQQKSYFAIGCTNSYNLLVFVNIFLYSTSQKDCTEIDKGGKFMAEFTATQRFSN